MSSRFAHPMTYWCDEHGCGRKQFQPDGELPEGWSVVAVVQHFDLQTTLHKCRACSEKVLADTPQ